MIPRRTFLLTAAALKAWAAKPLADEYVVLKESAEPEVMQVYSPGIVRLANGRLVATCDSAVRQPREGWAKIEAGRYWTNDFYTSDDRGRNWTHRHTLPIMHARPFTAGRSVYVLGHQNDLAISRSDDNGSTWSPMHKLSEGQVWHQAPCNVHHFDGRVYIVMERITDPAFKGWPVSVMAPVVMSAPVGADLTRRESWVFSNELTFNQAVARVGAPKMIGAPFYKAGNQVPDAPKDKRSMSPIGWLETNLVRFTDPNNLWHDPKNRTLHLWMRAHTGSTNLACIAKAVESEDRSRIEITLESAPSGEPMLYVPCPGGHLKFHILWDEPSKLFWLLSSQSTDSMTRPDRLPPERFNLPNNERHRLALHFSTNCVDWRFAGLVTSGASPKQARHYASMVVDGDDLHVLSRSGDHRAASAHDGNVITFHTVRKFRDLVY